MALPNEKFLDEMEVEINGSPFHPARTNCRCGDNIKARVSERIFLLHGGLYAVEIRLSEYVSDIAALDFMKNEQVDMGDISGLKYSNVKDLEIFMEENRLYDLLHCHEEDIDPVRLTTGKEKKPQRLTLDEVKLIIALRSGLRPEDLSGVKATVLHGAYDMGNGAQRSYNGLQIGEMVANITPQNTFGLIYVPRKKDSSGDFSASATPERMTREIMAMIGR